MKETFTDELIALQEAPTYFGPQRLERLKVIFEQVSGVIGLLDQNQARRNKLATILVVGSKL